MSDDRYLEDSSIQQGYYEDSPLSSILSANNLVIGSVLATGSILAYRSGLLAPAIKSFMKGSAERKPTASIIFNDLRKWFESDGIQEVEKSVFRKGGIKNTLKAFREMNVEEARNILNQSRDDVSNYISRLNETLDEFMSKNSNDIIENTANNTELLWNIKKANNAADFYSDEMIEARNVMKSKMYEDIMEKRIQTAESAAEQLKRKGLRKAQLSDLASYEIDSKGNIKLYDKTNYTFRAKDTDDVEIATRQIEDMLNSKRYTDSGIAISKNGQDMRVYQAKDNFMNMVVDDNLYIDRAGNFVDLRKKKVQRTEFIRNLATEWQIPIIKVNLLQMFGIDKIGKKTIPYATISEKTLAPSITGLYGRDKANTIQNAKSTVEKLKGVREGVTIINGDVYRISDDLKGITKIDYKYKKHVTEIPKEMDRGTIALNRRENSQRKMFGLSKKEFEDYKPEDGWRYQFQKVAKFFDIGYQESNSIKESLDGIAEGMNPDSFIESLVGRFRAKPYKSQTTVKTFSGISDFRDTPKNSFFVTNESISLKDVYINKFNKDIVKDYFKQYAADFTKNPELVNAKTSIPFFLIERTNQSLGAIGLALSENSTKSTWDTAKNMVLKRFLPAYGAYEVWNLLNTFGEEDTDNGKKAGNIQQRMAELYANIDIGLHNVADKLGISKVAKNLAEITPGSDMIGELPGINMINATQTGEERAEYWQHGYDPVRKGRYWSMNSSTPFIGGKIQYWKPNFLRRSMADAKYSDSLYGSRRERFAHILNPNYYDIKNYNTRPYLMTSPAFENVPLIGPLLAGTVGKIVKPQKRMHEEYWNENTPKSQQQIDDERRLQAIKTNNLMIQYNNQRRAEQSEKVKFNSQQDLGYIATLKELANVANDDMMVNKLRDSNTIQKVYKFTSQIPNVNQSNSIFGNNDETMYSNGSYPVEMVKALAQEKGMLQAYQTNSGAVSTIQLSSATGSFDKNKVNKKGYSLGQIMNVKENASAKDQSIITPDMINNVKMINPENPNDLSNTFSNQFKNATEVAGMYGFMGEAFVTGRPGQGNTVIETSGYHRSFNKAFWDQDFGGLSGDLSEIFRRYTQRRRTDQHYYNPIRNRMPDWLPGQGAFIDFQHGDPYSKISHGEERLPGEGYERLNDINMPEILKMKVGSSTIGKTKDEIIKHFLHQDEITDPELQDIVDTGTKQHEKIEKQLLDSGIGIDAEQEIKDEKNGIVGYYDIKLHDRTSLTGEAIMDIKTVGASKLEKIRKSGKPIDAHQRQVNWYLHETNPFNKGYIYYVDRDNPDNNYTIGFNYSHSMYKSTMNTLKEARDETMDMLNKGIISRGDFYEPLDRLRILADVAPYSDEFRQMNKQLSAMKLTDEQSDELKRIRDRVTQQRQQTRFYGYRFKYADVIAEKGTVERQIDAETYMIKGSDTPIKLAGLNITKKQENYQEAMDLLDKYMSKGNDIKILVAEDPTQRRNGDLLGTTKATVISNGVNVNRELIKRGLAEEKTDDFSAPAVHARFNAIERGVGSAWETMAHFDSLINNKLLAVRTAKEDYERRQVYGKDFKSWDHPIEDFVKPFLWTNMNRTGLFGIAAGSLTGYMLGRTPYGRFVGAIAGGLSIAGLKAYKKGYEAVKGERWIPKEKERQRELDDYIDKLKFIKNRRLFEVYAEKAKREDNFDVKQFIEDNKRKGNARKARANRIKEVKKDYKRTGDFDIKAFEKAGVEFDWKDKLFAPIRSIITGEGREKFKDAFERIMDIGVDEQKQAENAYKKHSPIIWQEIANRVEELLGFGPEPPKKKDIHWEKAHRRGPIKQQIERTKNSIVDAVETSKKKKQKALEHTVNAKINDNSTKKTVFNLPKNAMIAMEYYNASEATMYGYDPGEPLTNLIAALPKRDKNYFREFLKAPKRDRQEILSMAPKYMRRALQSAYGMKVDDKENLDEYFSKHYLPDEDWDGWQENFDLESMKVKMIQTQGDRLQDYGKWEDDKIKADMYGPVQIPNMSHRTKSIQEVKNTLEDLLGSAGYKNLNFEFQLGASTPSINLDVYQSKKDKYDKKLKERLGI